MINVDLINEIKRITITSLVMDDEFMETLILKGGNALSLGYGISDRASYDLDFSMEEDFKEDLKHIEERLESLVESGFKNNGYAVLDFKLNSRPKNPKLDLADFWGGYNLEFKLISQVEFDRYYPDHDKIRRSALALNPDNSTKLSIDISKYEYIGEHRVRKEFDGISYFVYAPELLVFEKVRALAQKLPEYATEVLKSHPYKEEERARPRDFYDIHAILENYPMDITNPECKDLLACVFKAKRVPLHYIKKIREMKEVHRAGYAAVQNTLSATEEDKGFDFYFDYFMEKFENFFD